MDMQIIEKLKAAKSKEELIEIAKKEGVDIAKDEAQKLFEKFKSSDGKLSLDDLKDVAGGYGKASSIRNSHETKL